MPIDRILYHILFYEWKIINNFHYYTTSTASTEFDGFLETEAGKLFFSYTVDTQLAGPTIEHRD